MVMDFKTTYIVADGLLASGRYIVISWNILMLVGWKALSVVATSHNQFEWQTKRIVSCNWQQFNIWILHNVKVLLNLLWTYVDYCCVLCCCCCYQNDNPIPIPTITPITPLRNEGTTYSSFRFRTLLIFREWRTWTHHEKTSN